MKISASTWRRVTEAVHDSERDRGGPGPPPRTAVTVGSYLCWARVDGPASGGLYPATLVFPDSLGWIAGDEVKLRVPNGETLSEDFYYLAMPAYYLSGNAPVWIAVATVSGGPITYVSNVCGTGFTVEYTTLDLAAGESSTECVDDPDDCCQIDCPACEDVPTSLPFAVSGWGGTLSGTAVWDPGEGQWRAFVLGTLWNAEVRLSCGDADEPFRLEQLDVTYNIPVVTPKLGGGYASGLFVEQLGLFSRPYNAGKKAGYSGELGIWQAVYSGTRTVDPEGCGCVTWEIEHTYRSEDPEHFMELYEHPFGSTGPVTLSVGPWGGSGSCAVPPPTTASTAKVYCATLTGMTGDCAGFNGDYTITHAEGGYYWLSTLHCPAGGPLGGSGGVLKLVLTELPSAYLHLSVGGGYTYFCASFDPDAGGTFTRVFPADTPTCGGSVPASITLAEGACDECEGGSGSGSGPWCEGPFCATMTLNGVPGFEFTLTGTGVLVGTNGGTTLVLDTTADPVVALATSGAGECTFEAPEGWGCETNVTLDATEGNVGFYGTTFDLDVSGGCA